MSGAGGTPSTHTHKNFLPYLLEEGRWCYGVNGFPLRLWQPGFPKGWVMRMGTSRELPTPPTAPGTVTHIVACVHQDPDRPAGRRHRCDTAWDRNGVSVPCLTGRSLLCGQVVWCSLRKACKPSRLLYGGTERADVLSTIAGGPCSGMACVAVSCHANEVLCICSSLAEGR